MPTTGSLRINEVQVHFHAERNGRNLRFEVYKIANDPNIDPLEIYSVFKQVASDVFRADVVSPRYDPAPVVEETPTPTEEVNGPQEPASE